MGDGKWVMVNGWW